MFNLGFVSIFLTKARKTDRGEWLLGLLQSGYHSVYRKLQVLALLQLVLAIASTAPSARSDNMAFSRPKRLGFRDEH